MALDFAQIDDTGSVTGLTARIGPEVHHSLIQNLDPGRFPLLARMRDYYRDVRYGIDDLAALENEIFACRQGTSQVVHADVLDAMSAVVRDCREKGLRLEAIAD